MARRHWELLVDQGGEASRGESGLSGWEEECEGERTKLFDVCDFFRNATVAQAKEFILQRVGRHVKHSVSLVSSWTPLT
jgi:hypothetical protein